MTKNLQTIGNRLKEASKEKTVNFWARMLLRVLAGGVLTIYSIFRMMIPVVKGQRVEIDVTDSRIMMGCIVILLSIELVLLIVRTYLNVKSKAQEK